MTNAVRYQYAVELMERGHPRSSAERAAGYRDGGLPRFIPARVPYVPRVETERAADSPQAETVAIMARVGKPFGVTPEMMQGPRRTRNIAWPRMAAMAAIRAEKPNLSYPAIGTLFNRDHTTILHGVREHQARMDWADFLIWAGNPEGQLELFREAA